MTDMLELIQDVENDIQSIEDHLDIFGGRDAVEDSKWGGHLEALQGILPRLVAIARGGFE